MSTIRYTVARNIPATDAHGKEKRIAVALVQHENGHRERVAIDEDFIRFAGEGIIDHEVMRAVSR